VLTYEDAVIERDNLSISTTMEIVTFVISIRKGFEFHNSAGSEALHFSSSFLPFTFTLFSVFNLDLPRSTFRQPSNRLKSTPSVDVYKPPTTFLIRRAMTGNLTLGGIAAHTAPTGAVSFFGYLRKYRKNKKRQHPSSELIYYEGENSTFCSVIDLSISHLLVHS